MGTLGVLIKFLHCTVYNRKSRPCTLYTYPLTCKNLESRFISLCFAWEKRNRCSDLLKGVHTWVEIQRSSLDVSAFCVFSVEVRVWGSQSITYCYFSMFIIASILVRSPTPLAETQPQTTTKPPQCFKDGCKHLLLYLSSDLLCKYWWQLSQKCQIRFSLFLFLKYF